MTKAWEMDRYNAKANYDFMREHFARCWACFSHSKPRSYFGPWLIERAHIVNKPRKLDRRLVNMLCSICHKANHGEIVAGNERPRITVAMMIGLKHELDPLWVDVEFMQKHSVRIIPDPVALPEEYLTMREINKPTRRRR